MFYLTHLLHVDYFDIYYNTFSDFIKYRLENDVDISKVKSLIDRYIDHDFPEFLESMKDHVRYDSNKHYFEVDDESLYRSEPWECAYCPFWMICRKGRQTVYPEYFRKDEPGHEEHYSVSRKQYYTAVAYATYGDIVVRLGKESSTVRPTQLRLLRDIDIDPAFMSTDWHNKKKLYYQEEGMIRLASNYFTEALKREVR